LQDADLAAIDECPADGDVSIAASVLPLQTPQRLGVVSSIEPTLARRVVITVEPGSLRRGETLLWTRVSLRTLGGTLAGWTRVQSHGVSVDLATATPEAQSAGSARQNERVAIKAGPGQLTVERIPATPRSLSSALTLDLLIVPGGIPIHEPAVRIHDLWSTDGTPIPPDAVHIDLAPLEHAPAYDVVEAEIDQEFVVMRSRHAAGTNASCKSAAHVRTMLVDHESVRPALWDLGTASLNAPRTRWLALNSQATGPMRAIFESPEAATAFANWIRVTGSTHAGTYALGLFERSAGGRALRPFAPIDQSSAETFRALQAADARALRVGPLGEP
jgi:hypothetical protein